MKQFFKNISATLTFLMVVFMHVYFALILLTKPALAEDAKSPTTQTVPTLEEAPKPPAPPSIKKKIVIKEDDDNINIKLNMKDGISIKGLQGAIEKLKELDEKQNTNGAKININDEEIRINGEDSEEGDSDEVVINTKNLNPGSVIANILEEVLVPIVLFICIFGTFAYLIYAKNRTRREYLETIKTLAQSGQPIPPELLSHLNTANAPKGNELFDTQNPSSIKGIKYIFWGLGIFGFVVLKKIGFGGLSGIGFIVLMIGAYHIYTAQILQKQKSRDLDKNTEVQK